MIDVLMPRLSDTMEEGTVAAWRKQVGDPVQAGDVLVEIETDKAVMEFEAYESGTLTRLLVQEGERAPIGGVIAVIDDGVPDDAASSDVPAPPAVTPTSVVPAPPVAVVTPSDASTAGGERLLASPLVRRLAREHQLDLSAVAGSGPGGRIVRADVASLLAGAASPRPTPSDPTSPLPTDTGSQRPQRTASAATHDGRGSERVPMTSLRRLVARRLGDSARDTPHIFLTAGADAEKLVELRRTVNAELTGSGRPTVSINDLVIRACALALREHPGINASYIDDDSPEMLVHSRVNIGVAIASAHGLVVPVVHDADREPLGRIGSRTREYIALAADRKLRPEHLADGTFTISNLGMFGVEQFTAIINPPEGAILAVGALGRRPTVVGDQVLPRHHLGYTLSADHRIIDGADGAKFLATLTGLLQQPWNLLV